MPLLKNNSNIFTNQCSVCDQSLRFARTVYGSLALAAFLLNNFWIILITSILMLIGAFSVKYNLFYQLYSLFINSFSKKESQLIKKNKGELSFACAIGSIFLFISFLLLYFNQLESFAWGLILIMSLLMFFAGLGGICTTSLIYALLKRSLTGRNEKK